jgi:methyl-accepting chemotaxis protein
MDWLKFAEQYGLASAGLALVFWYIVLPLKERHVKFLDKVEETNDRLAGTIDKQADILQGLQAGLNQLASNQKETSDEIKKLADIVEKMSANQQHLRMP